MNGMNSLASLTVNEMASIEVSYTFENLVENLKNLDFNPNIDTDGLEVRKVIVTDIPDSYSQNKIMDLLIIRSNYFDNVKANEEMTNELINGVF